MLSGLFVKQLLVTYFILIEKQSINLNYGQQHAGRATMSSSKTRTFSVLLADGIHLQRFISPNNIVFPKQFSYLRDFVE